MENTPEFMRARRRYKTLVREKQKLDSKNIVDDKLNSEIALIEQDFPQLKILFPDVKVQEAEPEKQTTQAQPEKTGTGVNKESPQTGNSKKSERSPIPIQMPTEKKPVDLLIRLYIAYNRKSAFGALNTFKTVILSAAVACLHYYTRETVPDLCTTVTPYLFCHLIHLTNIFRLFQLRETFNFPRTLVYLLMDYIPSLAISTVAYVLATCTLHLIFDVPVV